MKKITNIVTSLALALGVFVTPALVFAQSSTDIPTIEVGTSGTTSTTTTDTSSTAGVPETGIAPQPSALVRNLVVFAIGGSAGALMGLGIVSYKKRARSQN